MTHDDGHEDLDDIEEAGPTHPRFRERLAEVEDESLRSRNRKLLIVGAIILAVLLAAASTQSALFDVDEVRVVGTERVSPDRVRQVAAVELGVPILGLDTNAIEERLIELPEIDSVVASKSWRGVVTVEINERVPIARIDSPEGTIVVATDGIVLGVVGLDEDDQLPSEVQTLPEIAGAMFSTQAGNTIPDVLADALEVANELPADVVVVTERIEITVDSLVLRLVGGGSISLGDARDLPAKFDAVRAFLAEVDLSCLDTLNVRAPSVPVIVRTKNC